MCTQHYCNIVTNDAYKLKRSAASINNFFHWPHLVVPLLVFVLKITLVPEANDLVHTSPSYLAGAIGAPRGQSYSRCHISGVVSLPSPYQFPHPK